GLHGLEAVVAPAVALAGVQRDTVAGRDLPKTLHLHDAPHVVRGDDAGVAGLGGNGQHLGRGRDQALGLLVGDGIQHHQAAHEAELAWVLDAEGAHPDHAVARAALVGVPGDDAVVHHRPLRGVHADVAGPVELGLDLADLGGHQLVVVD